MDTILGLPINRFITFVKPAINWLAAIIGAWLVAKVNVLGIPGLDTSNTATYVAAGLTALLIGGLQQIGDVQWLKGHRIELENGGLAITDVGEDFPATNDVGDKGAP